MVKNIGVKKILSSAFFSSVQIFDTSKKFDAPLMKEIIAFNSSFGGHPGLDPGTRAIEATMNFSLRKNKKRKILLLIGI